MVNVPVFAGGATVMTPVLGIEHQPRRHRLGVRPGVGAVSADPKSSVWAYGVPNTSGFENGVVLIGNAV